MPSFIFEVCRKMLGMHAGNYKFNLRSSALYPQRVTTLLWCRTHTGQRCPGTAIRACCVYTKSRSGLVAHGPEITLVNLSWFGFKAAPSPRAWLRLPGLRDSGLRAPGAADTLRLSLHHHSCRIISLVIGRPFTGLSSV